MIKKILKVIWEYGVALAEAKQDKLRRSGYTMWY